MNESADLTLLGLNDSGLYSNKPPPGALRDWPWCSYSLPLPPEGSYGIATRWIWSFAPAVWIIMGTIGNLLSGIVICRRYRKLSSTAVYLLTLAVSDTVFLYTDPLKYWLENVLGIAMRGLNNVCCKLFIFLAFASFHISAWILVAVTIERVVAIIWPYKTKTLPTGRNALIITCCIVTFMFAMDSHFLYGFEIRQHEMSTNSTVYSDCFAAYGSYNSFFVHQWFWIHFVLGFLVPLFLILAGNTVVIIGLRNNQSQKKRLHGSSSSMKTKFTKKNTYESKSGGNRKLRKTHSWPAYLVKLKVETNPNGPTCNTTRIRKTQIHHTRSTKALTIMLLLLNTIFFISQTPMAVFLVYLPYVEEYVNSNACTDMDKYMTGKEKVRFWQAVTTSFAHMNASINFILYVISGSQFRQELFALFTCSTRTDRIELKSRTPCAHGNISNKLSISTAKSSMSYSTSHSQTELPSSFPGTTKNSCKL